MTVSPKHPRYAFQPAVLIAIALCLLLVSNLSVRPSGAETADPVLAKVNGVEIHESDVTVAEEEFGPIVARMDPSTRRQNIVSFLIDLKLAAKAADGKKLRDTDEFKKQAGLALDRLSMDALLASEGESAATDAALKQAYEDVANATRSRQEAHVRHILVETEAEAKQVVAELKKGADFGALAKKDSKDASAANGGDLGFVSRAQLEPDFGKAVFALDIGKTSDPVKTRFGWHVIRVEEKRDGQVPPFDQIKPMLETIVIRKAQADFVSKLHDGAKIERFDLAAAQPKDTPDPKAASAKTDKK
jgi:peptidyl-prolyl cis-trans isomerase C